MSVALYYERDANQLPAVVTSQTAKLYKYEQSLFARFTLYYEAQERNGSVFSIEKLNVQYRMHPDISQFPRFYFYKNELEDGENVCSSLYNKSYKHDRKFSGSAVTFFDMDSGKEQRGHTSLYNKSEVAFCVQTFMYLRTTYPDIDFSGKIGLITPYKSQKDQLRSAFVRNFGQEIIETIDIGTVDSFQGKEKDIVIFSCVRASPVGGVGFLADLRRMNVALTRAKFKLILIGRIESLVRNVHWKAYIDDCAGKKQLIRVDESYFSKTSSASGIKESLGASALEDINLKETTNNYCEQRRRIDNIDSTNSYTPHGFTNRLHNSPANSSSAPVTSSGTTLFNSGTRRDDYISGSPPRKYNSYSNSPGGDSEQHFPSKHHYNVANRSRNHEREDSSKHSPKNTDTRRDIFKGGSIKSSKLKRRRTSYASPHSFTLRKRAIFYKAEAYNTHHTKRAKRRTRDGGSGNPSITDPPV
jgi:hypothetical protein